MKLRKFVILVFTMLFSSHSVFCCFILFDKDADNILVANHEDWFGNDAAIKINPPSTGKYGSVIFTFLSEGWAQGGMNEKGLFFDAAHTPYQEIHFDSSKRKPQNYPWQEILDKTATVQEALQLLQKYSLEELEEATVMLADATGDAVILGVHNNALDIRRLVNDYLIQTNFNQWHPELSDEPVCPRYQTAEQMISTSHGATKDYMLSILKRTHQDSLTVYSNIYDLKNKTVLTYHKRDFENPIVTSLPQAFQDGNCELSLDSLARNPSFTNCYNTLTRINVTGKIIDESGKPIPYVNIGILDKNAGTLSDPDGSFDITLPGSLINDSLIFSSIGFETLKIPVHKLSRQSYPITIQINSTATLLNEITVSDKKLNRKVARLGWMGGKDGVLPLDTIMGGGAVALLVEAPGQPFYLEKLQVRLMYNSKDTLKLRFHVFTYDSIKHQPGNELLTKEIILMENKRFGWLRFDLSKENIFLNQKYVCIGFEWIDERNDRIKMLAGLRDWEKWKEAEFKLANKKVQYIPPTENQSTGQYKYYGNMMDWPGFKTLPPFTGLMVETGKTEKTKHLLTFERKTSFGEWKEIPSTLNAVITISH
jgi:hypothetical protein